MKGGHKKSIFEIFEKKTENENFEHSLIVPKYLKGETLSAFWHIILLQNVKKIEGGSFGDTKKNSKKVAQCRKKLK